ncbi:MAG: hypothetical protein EON90_09875 [Brevundimonas sp.]|nr:MAG: hypothetical protein EON90_09875 [Brevundimonas sp.]
MRAATPADDDGAICQALQSPKYQGTYALARIDLNSDGRREAVAYLVDQGFCGTGGCTMVVLTPSGSTDRRIGNTPTTRLPIRLLRSSHNGWRDIQTDVRGYGVANEQAIVSYNGHRYLRQDDQPPPTNEPIIIADTTPLRRCS